MELATWRDISIVYLGIQCMIGLLIPLAAFYFIWRGARWLYEKLEFLMGEAQRYSRLARDKTEQYSALAAEPLIRGHKAAAQAGATWERLAPGAGGQPAPTGARSQPAPTGARSQPAPTGARSQPAPKVYNPHTPGQREGA